MRRLDRIEREWIDSWTVEEAVAVYEFCTMMQDHLWQRHEIALSEQVFEREYGDERTGEPHDREPEHNLDLPLDEIPF